MIAITQGKVVIIDDEDYALVKPWKWQARYNDKSKTWYAVREVRLKGKRVGLERMHREIMNAKPSEIVDHRDHNGLNNQKDNLRKCTTPSNSRNRRISPHSSKYKGVYWSKKGKIWRAQICVNWKNMSLGSYSNEVEAALVYNEAAMKFFGEYALLNEIPASLIQEAIR